MSDERFKIPPDTRVYEDSSRVMSLGNLPALYHIVQSEIPAVHEAGYEGRGVKIVYLDTGYTPHELLPEPYLKKSRVPGESDRDGNGHGNHVMGTGSGLRDSNGNCLGAAPKSEAGFVKVLSNQGSGDTRWIRQGMLDAAESGADVISMSLGDSGGPIIPEDIAVIDRCYELGVKAIVVAAGNAGFNGTRNTIGRIASYEGYVICTGALLQNGQNAPFTSGGPAMDVMTYGSRIVSAGIKGNNLITMDGTSMACPLMAGYTALIINWHWANGLRAPTGCKEWEAYFGKFSKDLGVPGKDQATGFGLPTLVAAMKSLRPLENV